jgi:TadE-like protein
MCFRFQCKGQRRRSVQTDRGQTSQQGQSLMEFAMILPLMLLLVLGVIEVGYALFEAHILARLAREGSNLISRQTTLQEAQTSIVAAASHPVAFGAKGRLVFSVITTGTGGANLNKAIISQRLALGSLSAPSKLGDPPASSYGPAPHYTAINSDNDAAIRVSGPLPNGLVLSAGQFVYLTEVYHRHDLITPFDRFGVTLPTNLYASAFF